MMQRRSMPCYGDAETLDDIRRMFGYVFDPATPKGGGLPQLELFRIMGPFCARRPRSRSRFRSGTARGRFSVSASAASRI